MDQTLSDKISSTNNFMKKEKINCLFYQLTEQNMKVWRSFKEITLTFVWFIQKMVLNIFLKITGWLVGF